MTTQNNNYAVIMAGGKGERFWPLSTSAHPKQLLSLVGSKPLIALAVERLKNFIPLENVLIITGKSLLDATHKAVPELPESNIVGEPFGRDTAAACALASALVKARNPSAAFCILTADHIIGEVEVFQSTLSEAMDMALKHDILITIGIQPAFPSSAYGYIEAGDKVDVEGDTEFLNAKRFVEKPDASTAQKYIDAGNFYWNSGMFVWSVASVQKALEQHAPDLKQMADKMEAVADSAGFDTKLEEEYSKLEKISVDYAIMEKAENIVMAKGVFPWDDVGSWNAIGNHFDKDDSRNVVVGNCEMLDSAGNIVISDNRLTAIIGVEDLVVVQARKATLICHKDRAEDVKKLVKLLNEKEDYQQLL